MQLTWDVWIMLTSLVRLAGQPVTNAPFPTPETLHDVNL